MGKEDLYPFVLAKPVIDKLAFVHDLVRDIEGRAAVQSMRALKRAAAGRELADRESSVCEAFADDDRERAAAAREGEDAAGRGAVKKVSNDNASAA
jgi:hypothetical protein